MKTTSYQGSLPYPAKKTRCEEFPGTGKSLRFSELQPFFGEWFDSSTGTRQIDASKTLLKLSRPQRYIVCDQFDRADHKPSLPYKSQQQVLHRAMAMLRLK